MVIRKVALWFCCVFLLEADELDQYLNQKGFHLTPTGTAVYEGYITPKQREAFVAYLEQHPSIQRIAEVGFNAGHTSEIFLDHVQNSQMVSFDINFHAYTQVGVEFIRGKYKDRFQFVEGDSRTTIKEYGTLHPQEKFDLIYIDGCHLFAVCLDDILNFKSFAHKNTVVWIDDYNSLDVQNAVDYAERLRIIDVVKSKWTDDEFGVRAWIEARYVFRD